MVRIKKEIIFAGFILIVIGALIGILPNVIGQQTSVCCEQTNSNLFCQNVPDSECKANSKQAPTACSSTSYCKEGTCYDSNEGTCTDNTPQLVCNNNGGIWSEGVPPQCNLGCCALGDQAAFVTLVRCKRLSSLLGLETNYRQDISDEVSCILSVQNQEKGACIYEFEFERTCKFTTKENCDSGAASGGIKGEFYSGKLCTAEELNAGCVATKNTVCLPGKEEVYFVDNCGNPANIYDVSKINDKEYWTNIKTKTEACNPESANANSNSCGNCNYLLGSFCRKSKGASYGENICADLNCENTQNGNSYKHGESWCVYDDAGESGKGMQSVGSRFYKHICINGEEVLEQCADLRNEVCIQDAIEAGGVEFSQAACRVNRWLDCVAQDNQDDCENTDKRDCLWKPITKGFFGLLIGNIEKRGVCVPQNPPGLEFWKEGDAETACSQAKVTCVAKYEKGLFGKEKCVENCECEGDDEEWKEEREEVCLAMGDCGGPRINFVGTTGKSKSELKKAGKKDSKTAGTTQK